MNIKNAFNLRDEVVTDELVKLLAKYIPSEVPKGDVEDLIGEAFAGGNKIWEEEFLPDMIGKDAAKGFLRDTVLKNDI